MDNVKIKKIGIERLKQKSKQSKKIRGKTITGKKKKKNGNLNLIYFNINLHQQKNNSKTRISI